MLRTFIIIFVLFKIIFAQSSFEPGVILFKVKNPQFVKVENNYAINSPDINKIFKKYKIKYSKKLPHLSSKTKGWYEIEFPLNSNLEIIKSELLNCNDIEKVTLNYEGELCSTPNDNFWNEQWSLQKIGVDLAWDVVKPDNSILVGIIDSGIDYNHEDLVDNIWHNPYEIPNNNIDDDNNGYIDDVIGYDFQSDDNDPYDIGITNYHGTRISGVISAKTYNSIGISGIAGGWYNSTGVKLIGLKIVNPSTGLWDQVDAYYAIMYLAALKNNGNTVIANMSIANYFDDDYQLALFKSGIEEAKNAGVIMIAASGNADPKNEDPKYRTYPEVDELPAPARWDGVLAIGASKDGSSLADEKRSYYSMYDIPDDPFSDPKLLIVAPVDTSVNLSINIKTTYPLEPYYISWFHGTSAACPLVTGTASLLLSINKNFAYTDIETILKNTAEKIGNYNYNNEGRAVEVGYGRLNAYQAVLLGAAYANKSQYASATYANNARHLVKDDGYLYEIFTSGGEIFFRRSNNNGSSWQVTKRLTTGNGSNSRPAISAFYDNSLHVVWQHKVADKKWDIYYTYSTDHGNSWHTPTTIEQNVITSTYQNNGPQPVIAYSFVQEQFMKLMVVYTTSNGLYYTTKTSAGGSWATPAHISGSSYENQIRFPSLSGNVGYFALVYDTRYNGVYSRTYNGSWSNETRFDWDGRYDRETCVAMEKEGGSMLAAYVARHKENLPFSLYFRKGYENNTWSNFEARFDEENSKDYRRPTLTYFDANYSNPYAICIIAHTSANRVVMQKYYGQYSSWQENHIAYDGREAQLTGYAYNAPQYCWTDQSASPYLVKLSSTYLPKTAQPTEYKDIYARNAVVANSLDGTAQVLEVSDYIVHTKSGKEYRIAFKKYPDDTTKLTLENIWNYMDSEPVELPEDATELSYSKKIYTVFPPDSIKKQSNTTVFASTEYQLVIADAQTKAPLSVIDKETKSGDVTVNISAFAGRKVILYPSLQVQLSDKTELHFELTDIFRPIKDKTEKLEAQNPNIAQSDIPANFELFSNYPNPFNPSTTIRFSLPKDAMITLTVFDLSGKKVKTLVNGFNKSGYHQVQWNGKDDRGRTVASGMYFYVLKMGESIKARKMFLLR